MCESNFAKVAHSRARPPRFSTVSVRLLTDHCPASFFRAGIAILARKVAMECLAKLEMISARASFAFGPPCWASSRARASFSVPLVFSVTQKPVGPRSTCRPRPVPFECSNFPGPMQRLGISMRRTPSCCVERCTGLAAPDSSWPRPTRDRQTWVLWRAFEFGAVEWLTRMLRGSTVS